MRRTKGFTLIELMVVVSIIALLAMMLVPALQRAVGMANKAACAGNENGIYKGVVLYQQSNDQQYMMCPGKGWDTVDSGTAYLPIGATAGVEPIAPPYKADGSSDLTTARSVTTLMFMLVRDGQGAKLFTCQADSTVVPEPTPQSSCTVGGVTSMQYNWDFSSGMDGGGTKGSKRNVSYSFQCPIYGGASPAPDTSGIVNPDQSLVILADRTPTKATDFASGKSPLGKFTGGGTATWAPDTMTGDSIKPYNSQNHFSGEMFNVLYAGGNVASVKSPLCGTTVSWDSKARQDNIFSAASAANATYPDDGDVVGDVDASKHLGKKDTYLWGGADKK